MVARSSYDSVERMRKVAVALAALVLGACVSTPAPTPPPPTSSPSISKPPSGQAPLPPPTYVRWAVDKSDDIARPYRLDLFYDGIATDFRIVDASGRLVLRVPIIGSGIFSPETCVAKARPSGKTEGFTGISIDASALQQFMTNAASYMVEADSVAGATVKLPLSDSGCRAS